jgi:hypothetical protein
MPESTAEVLTLLRRLCLALPDVTERLSHGEPAWFVGQRLFLSFADHHHDDRVAFWAAAPDGAQEALVESDPGTYFRPPYVGHRGWIGVYLDVPIDWPSIEMHVRQAHAAVADRTRSRATRSRRP